MRKENEQLVASYNVNVYANADQLNDPSGAGASPAEFSQTLTSDLTDGIQEHVSEKIQEDFSEWGDKLRCEVTPIT